jgi:hypothetical protein
MRKSESVVSPLPMEAEEEKSSEISGSRLGIQAGKDLIQNLNTALEAVSLPCKSCGEPMWCREMDYQFCDPCKRHLNCP